MLEMFYPTTDPQNGVRVNKKREKFDLIVVGSGIAGLVSAVRSAELGLKVLLLEKSDKLCSGLSQAHFGLFPVSDTPHAQNALCKEIASQNSKNCEENIAALLQEHRQVLHWLRSQGILWRVLDVKQLCHTSDEVVFDVPCLVQALVNRAHDLKVTVYRGTRAETLLSDGQRITGLVAIKGNVKKHYLAKKGVVLATGGYARNSEVLASFTSLVASAIGAQGDGVQMAMAFGAQLTDVQYMEPMYGYRFPPQSLVDDYALTYRMGAIIVNKNAERFTNESFGNQQIAQAVLSQSDARSWLIFDEKIRKRAMIYPTEEKLWSPIDKGFEVDYLSSAETLEEAARKAGLDAKKLAKSVEQYNRTQEDKNRISSAPFYIYAVSALMIPAYCGLSVTPQGRVLDYAKEQIPGLWAIGEMAGGLYGVSVLSDFTFFKDITMGFIASNDIASPDGE